MNGSETKTIKRDRYVRNRYLRGHKLHVERIQLNEY
jgi:hypothetical protein